jgi:NTP pyrophosphatase (non-canonical NTP hydrolase)
VTFNWPFKQPPPPTAAQETSIPLDQQGIPILNEVVEAVELGPPPPADPNQTDLPLFDTDPDHNPASSTVNLETLREQLRDELLQTVAQVADSLTERFRADLEQTLRKEVERVLDERFGPPTDPGQQAHGSN